MATNAELLRRYTARGLQLIRVSNGLDAAAQKELTALAVAIRQLLAATPPATAGTRALASMLGDIEAAIIARYAEISAAQIASHVELAGIEAEFARRVGSYANAPSRAALARAMSSMLFLGNSPQSNWDHAAQQLAFRVGAAMRDAAATGADESVVRAQVLGTGPTNRGGLLEGARREASRLTDAGVQSAAGIGRAEAWRANGVNAVRWHAILDPKVCPDCGMRAGKLYTLDAEPIGHSVPLVREPPLHWNCRCMLVPQKFKGGVPDDSGPEGESFARYLESLTDDEQAALLGKGRAQLWRSGTITLRDLIGQGGQVMSVGDLRQTTLMNTFASRTEWPASFPDVAIHQTAERIVKQHPDYPAAKAGDFNAASRLVRDMASAEAIEAVAAMSGGKPATLVPVFALEAEGKNAIPVALAALLREQLGWKIEPRVVQVNRPQRTGRDGYYRLAAQPLFGGNPTQGGRYVMVDDFIGQGATLASLHGFLRVNGGDVLGATALTGKATSARIAISSITLAVLRRVHGEELEQWWISTFGFGFDRLTESEARYLIARTDADRVRAEVLARRP